MLRVLFLMRPVLSRVCMGPVRVSRVMNDPVIPADPKVKTIRRFFSSSFSAFAWSFCCRKIFSFTRNFSIILLQLMTYNHSKNLWYYRYRIFFRWIVSLTPYFFPYFCDFLWVIWLFRKDWGHEIDLKGMRFTGWAKSCWPKLEAAADGLDSDLEVVTRWLRLASSLSLIFAKGSAMIENPRVWKYGNAGMKSEGLKVW